MVRHGKATANQTGDLDQHRHLPGGSFELLWVRPGDHAADRRPCPGGDTFHQRSHTGAADIAGPLFHADGDLSAVSPGS